MSQPISIVIFGASGDLTERKLIPALYNAYVKKRLPERFNIIGVSRSPYTHDSFRTKLCEKAVEFTGALFNTEQWEAFARHIWYQPGNGAVADDYPGVIALLRELEMYQTETNRLYYLSTAPNLYAPIVQNLASAGLTDETNGWRHVVIEKPYGHDLDSALELNRIIHSVLNEKQVYRIDHYLGKETAQNILFLRFANAIFEPIWNRNYIANVQISVVESVDVGHRAGYYDESGVLRDMFQNHLLQLVALVGMEPPVNFAAESLHDERAKLLRSIRPISLHETVRAQYRGYREARGVAEQSQTPTYAALKLLIDNWRWQGVPFYLRSGKALKTKRSEINIVFKSPPHMLFKLPIDQDMNSNVLSICIQPDEGINLRIETKVPDSLQDTRSVKLGFAYTQYFGDEPLPDAYERLILDAVKGDASLFTRSDAIEASWQLIDPIIHGWEQDSQSPRLVFYEPGTWGPLEADRLLGLEGFIWRLGCGNNG